MVKDKLPKTIMCILTGKREQARGHIEKFCRFYAGQPQTPSLGNEACHEECTVPKRFDIRALAKPGDGA